MSLGERIGHLIVVTDGVAPGELVAVDGFELLKDAVVVKPVGPAVRNDSKNAIKP